MLPPHISLKLCRRKKKRQLLTSRTLLLTKQQGADHMQSDHIFRIVKKHVIKLIIYSSANVTDYCQIEWHNPKIIIPSKSTSGHSTKKKTMTFNAFWPCAHNQISPRKKVLIQTTEEWQKKRTLRIHILEFEVEKKRFI